MSSVDVPSLTPRERGGESAEPAGRTLSGEKAQRIVDAMRNSVAKRGTAASTFDHVAREAGVSRGLLHYYFATKEPPAGGGGPPRHASCGWRRWSGASRRRTCAARLHRADGAEPAGEPDRGPGFHDAHLRALHARAAHPEIAVEYADLMRRTREHVARMLAVAQSEGIVELARRARSGHGDPVLARRRLRPADARASRARLLAIDRRRAMAFAQALITD